MDPIHNRPNNPPYLARQKELARLLASNNTKLMVLNPGPSMVYLTGLHFHLSERPVILIITANSPPYLILPELEGAKIKNLPYPLRAYTYGEDPEEWSRVFLDAFSAATSDFDQSRVQIGVERLRIRYIETEIIQNNIQNAVIIPGEKLVSKLRLFKDEQEISSMRKAVEIAQIALEHTIPSIQPGVTEKEIANELTIQLLRAGSEPKLPFSPIVSGGPNSANPHATPSDRQITHGDLLVIDWGATSEGYISDITRTFAIGDIELELRSIAGIVHEANQAGRAITKPGIKADQIDRSCRNVINESGYAQYFIHRTGHGIGLEVHEPPYIRSGNDRVLEPGMTFTIEPGIYLPYRGGVRIEDDVLVTESGAESLSTLPRKLFQIS